MLHFVISDLYISGFHCRPIIKISTNSFINYCIRYKLHVHNYLQFWTRSSVSGDVSITMNKITGVETCKISKNKTPMNIQRIQYHVAANWSLKANTCKSSSYLFFFFLFNARMSWCNTSFCLNKTQSEIQIHFRATWCSVTKANI